MPPRLEGYMTGYMRKEAIIGSLLGSTSPERAVGAEEEKALRDMYEEWRSLEEREDAERLKTPAAAKAPGKEEGLFASLRQPTPKSLEDFQRVRVQPYSGGGSYNGRDMAMKLPSGLYSDTAGHEIGHALTMARNREAGYAGERGVFGMGLKAGTALRSERDATNEYLRRLSPEARRAAGAFLARAYDSYRYVAKTNPEGNMVRFADQRDPLSRAETGVLPGRGSSVQGPAARRLYPNNVDEAAAARLARRWGSAVPGLERLPELTRQRSWDAYELMDRLHDVRGRHAAALRAKRAGMLRGRTLDKILKLDPEARDALKREALEYVREARKAFGPGVGLGAARDIRQAVSELKARASAPVKFPVAAASSAAPSMWSGLWKGLQKGFRKVRL